MPPYTTNSADGNIVVSSEVDTRAERWARRISREKGISVTHALTVLQANGAVRLARDE
jgi:hypothetical protein